MPKRVGLSRRMQASYAVRTQASPGLTVADDNPEASSRRALTPEEQAEYLAAMREGDGQVTYMHITLYTL